MAWIVSHGGLPTGAVSPRFTSWWTVCAESPSIARENCTLSKSWQPHLDKIIHKHTVNVLNQKTTMYPPIPHSEIFFTSHRNVHPFCVNGYSCLWVAAIVVISPHPELTLNYSCHVIPHFWFILQAAYHNLVGTSWLEDASTLSTQILTWLWAFLYNVSYWTGSPKHFQLRVFFAQKMPEIP